MTLWLSWVKALIVGIFSLFFLIFGVEVLIGAYSLKTPRVFIMYFFSGSFIVLISLVGLVYMVIQIYIMITGQPDQTEED